MQTSAVFFDHASLLRLKQLGQIHFPFTFSLASDFKETPSLFAVRATVAGVRFISAAIASTDFNDVASCMKRRSSAKDQRVLVL
jgi:hypothetical protein